MSWANSNLLPFNSLGVALSCGRSTSYLKYFNKKDKILPFSSKFHRLFQWYSVLTEAIFPLVSGLHTVSVAISNVLSSTKQVFFSFH